jgi:hypothetical protein
MEQALRAARERGIETLEVTTLPDNVAAQKLVRKFGAKLKLEDGVYSGTVETSVVGDVPEDDRVAGDEEETGLKGNKGHKATIASRLISAKGADTSIYTAAVDRGDERGPQETSSWTSVSPRA